MDNSHRGLPPSSREKMVRPFLLTLLLLSLGLAFYVIWPFINALIMAILMAILFTPMQDRALRLLRGRPSLAALLVVTLLTLVILVPLSFFLSVVIFQSLATVEHLSQWLGEVDLEALRHHPIVMGAQRWLREYLSVEIAPTQLRDQLMEFSKGTGGTLLRVGTGFIGNLASLAVNFSIMIFAAFFFLRDGRTMIVQLKGLSPLREEQEERILDRIRATTRSVFLGNMLTAMLEGVAGGLAMAVVGIPPFFWGMLMALASFVPVVGIGLVWVPLAIYLASTGAYIPALLFSLWCAVIVGSIDNFVRPFLMRGEGQMSPFYVFLGIVGGIQVFGLAGLVYGPLIIAFASIMLYVYKHEYHDILAGMHEGQSPASPEEKH